MSIPSIFNDVIGPVMRGPSSSHSAAAVRIGLLARALMDGDISEVRVDFDQAGSLPTTHDSQGSDMGLCGGLLGFDVSDSRLLDYERETEAAGLKISYATGDFGDPHPNTYRLALSNLTEEHTLVAISTGGGMIEVIEIDGCTLSMLGDLFVTLIYFDGDENDLVRKIKTIQPGADPIIQRGSDKSC